MAFHAIVTQDKYPFFEYYSTIFPVVFRSEPHQSPNRAQFLRTKARDEIAGDTSGDSSEGGKFL